MVSTPIDSALTGGQSWQDRLGQLGVSALKWGPTSPFGPAMALLENGPWAGYQQDPNKYLTGVPSFSPITGAPETVNAILPNNTTAPNAPWQGPTYNPSSPSGSPSIADPYLEFQQGMKDYNTIGGAIDTGQDAYQQYLNEMEDRWRLQQGDIQAQYQPSIDAANDQLGDLQGQLAQANAAYGDFESGMAGLDTEIPYGAISDADTSRVERHYNEAEGRLAEALNIMPDELSNRLVSELWALEDVTETMLMDDINSVETLHGLGASYAQAIADEVYTGSSLEAKRAKLEMQAQFDKAIEDAKKEIERLKKAQAEAIARAQASFQMNYEDFDVNREALTESAFMDWAKQEGMSDEDASQSWSMYSDIYGKYSGQIATQGDFDRIQRNVINDQAFQYANTGIWNQIYGSSGLLTLTRSQIEDPMLMQAYDNAVKLDAWVNSKDLTSVFGSASTGEGISSVWQRGYTGEAREFVGLLQGVGISTADANAMVARGYDGAQSGGLMSYNSPEARAARQAYSTSDLVDKHWEDIYFGTMTIPVESRYVVQNEQTGAFFPTAGPSTWYSGTGAFSWDDPRDWVHKGVDIGGFKGTPVLAAKSGTISSSGYSNVSGHYVIIDHGGGEKTKYMHLAYPPPFPTGQKVDGGTSIGQVGNTGNASDGGYHLHFEYWQGDGYVDPKSLVGWPKSNIHDPPSNAYSTYTPKVYDVGSVFT